MADEDHGLAGGSDEYNFFNFLTSFGIHIFLIIAAILLKLQYDRTRYRYPKGPHHLRNITEIIGFYRKKRGSFITSTEDYGDCCTVRHGSTRLVLLNSRQTIDEIFVERADLVSDKIDGYLESQLRHGDGKHVRTGIFFRHQDNNARLIHRALVHHIDQNLIGKRLDAAVQSQLETIHFSENVSVQHVTFNFAVRLLTRLCSSATSSSINNSIYEVFEQNLYKISKTVHADTIQKSAISALSKVGGLSEIISMNENVLNYIKSWVEQRKSDEYLAKNLNKDTNAASTFTISQDILDAILNVTDESAPRLDSHDIAACLMDIIMHGSEMIKCALSWSLLYAVQYPEEIDQCRCEARAQSYRSFNLETAKSLVRCQAFVREVLRLSPVAPIIAHSTLQDFRWRDFHFQKRTLFGANLMALHYSSVWKDATKFDVSRWLGDNLQNIPHSSYAPFGIGPRSCVAEKHLVDLLVGIFAVLISQNDFIKVGNLPKPTDGTCGLSNVPGKFSLKTIALNRNL